MGLQVLAGRTITPPVAAMGFWGLGGDWGLILGSEPGVLGSGSGIVGSGSGMLGAEWGLWGQKVDFGIRRGAAGPGRAHLHAACRCYGILGARGGLGADFGV